MKNEKGTPGNRSSGDWVGPVAQRIRARGYEPRCRGFESLLAHNRPKREFPFPLGPGTVEQRSIPNLHRGIDGDSQISQNRMGYDEIECNRNKDRGNRLPTLNGQSEPFHSELQNSELIKSPQVGFEPTTSQLTADRSTTELLRNNGKFELIEFNSRSQPMTNMSSNFLVPQ
ncbi:hypothetical protein Lal_00044991 [Lupinus albus]|nr:hypothetical protein Lal_00044991 [Lupinus albus]